MKREHVVTAFDTAGFTVSATQEISNQYWPDVENYRKVRSESPWWIVKTDCGVFVLGDRKRVTSIDWRLSDFPNIDASQVTADDVTKDAGTIHAWSLLKVIEYLTAWRQLALQVIYECRTCKDRGEIGGHVGQTPEQFDYVTEPCPDCGEAGRAEREES